MKNGNFGRKSRLGMEVALLMYEDGVIKTVTGN